MRITIPELNAPVCKCGSRMEIYAYVAAQKIRVKCHYCGFEKSEVIPSDIGHMSLWAFIATTRSIME